MDEYQVLAPNEILKAHNDLLLHYLNSDHKLINLKTTRADKQATKIS